MCKGVVPIDRPMDNNAAYEGGVELGHTEVEKYTRNAQREAEILKELTVRIQQ